MKIYRIMILITMIMQSFSSLCMDKSNEQQLIQAFVQKEQLKRTEAPITFCSPINSEFAEYFNTDTRLPLSNEAHTAIKNMSLKLSKAKKIDIKIVSPTKEPKRKEIKQIIKPDAVPEKKEISKPQAPDLALSVTVHARYTCEGKEVTYKNNGVTECPFDRAAIENEALKTYKRLLNRPSKSKKKGPYLHRETKMLFAPIDENRMYVYNDTTKCVAVLDEPYIFPDSERFAQMMTVFSSRS